MRLKLYRAPTMDQALRTLRAELGADALIVGSRTVRGEIEITAAVEPAPEPPTPAPAPPPALDPPRLAPWRPKPLPRPSHAALLGFHNTPASLAARLDRQPLESALAAAFRFAPLSPGPTPLLFAGPHGAGKTLTTAKLATRLTLAGRKPLLIGADRRRAAANEQLAAYAKLLDLPLIPTPDPVALARSLAGRDPERPVLIDTAGADARRQPDLDLLSTLATCASAHMVLVLPAGLDSHEAADLAHAYAAIGAERLIVTRLDCTRRLGAALAAAEAGLAFAEAGFGPGAADRLDPISPAKLALWLRNTAPADLAPPQGDAA